MPRLSKKTDRAPVSILEKLVAKIDDRLGGAPDGDTVPTGFASLDRLLAGGLRRRDLVVLAGDVGSGKSALALGIAIRAASAGTPTLYFSGEMGPERVMERALALEARVSVDDLRQGRLDDAARAAVGAAAVRLRGVPAAGEAAPRRRFRRSERRARHRSAAPAADRRLAPAHHSSALRGSTGGTSGSGRARTQGTRV